jgi:hypothetical protein
METILKKSKLLNKAKGQGRIRPRIGPLDFLWPNISNHIPIDRAR